MKMDNKLKQRLIGASVLVALGVIIIPELVKDPFEQTDPVVTINAPEGVPEKSGLTISLPATEPPISEQEAVADAPREVASPPQPETSGTVSAETVAPTTPAPAPPSAPKPAPAKPPTPPQEVQIAQAATPSPAPAPAKSPEPKSPPQAAAQSPTPPAPKTADKTTPKPSPKTRPAKPVELPKIQLVGRSMTSSSPKAAGGWTVQVGSFSSEANARQLSAKLRNQRFPASVERVKVNNRVSYRVRVGKQASRTESEKILARMEREAGVKGQVMPTSN